MGVVPTLYDSLILPLRAKDALDGNGLLELFLSRPQYHVDATMERILSLSALDNAITCPGEYLQYLKDQVGLTVELDNITAGLDEQTLRKLIVLAIPLWKKRGTRAGLISVIRLLTGRTPLYRDWFYYRLQLDTALIGEAQQGWDSYAVDSADDSSSSLHCLDDGDIDETLLINLIQLMRPSNERIDVTLVDFLDVFSGTLDRWEAVERYPLSEIVDGRLSLTPTTGVRAVLPTVQWTDLDEYTSNHTFTLYLSGDVHDVYWYEPPAGETPAGYYRVMVSDVAVGERAQLTVQRSSATGHGNDVGTGLPRGIMGDEDVEFDPDLIDFVTLYSGPFLHGLALAPGRFDENGVYFPGIMSSMKIETCRSTTNLPYFRILIDGSLQYETPITGDPGSLLIGGGLSFLGSASNAGPVLVDFVEIWRTPMRVAQIGPDGVVTSDNFYQ